MCLKKNYDTTDEINNLKTLNILINNVLLLFEV